jgi:hypothetical protein
LSVISLGTIVVLVAYHLSLAIAPAELRDEGALTAVGHPGVHADRSVPPEPGGARRRD